MAELEEFRSDKNNLFSRGEESPLDEAQKKDFKGLNYYPPNQELIFRNLPLQPSVGEQVVQIPTSAGDTEPYKILGKLTFDIGDNPFGLTVYQSTSGQQFFLPFRDKTNGSETYHEGRFVEVEIEDNKVVELDFNYAYNPYCAYNDHWRCPITPKENTLDIEIKAGEKVF